MNGISNYTRQLVREGSGYSFQVKGDFQSFFSKWKLFFGWEHEKQNLSKYLQMWSQISIRKFTHPDRAWIVGCRWLGHGGGQLPRRLDPKHQELAFSSSRHHASFCSVYLQKQGRKESKRLSWLNKHWTTPALKKKIFLLNSQASGISKPSVSLSNSWTKVPKFLSRQERSFLKSTIYNGLSHSVQLCVYMLTHADIGTAEGVIYLEHKISQDICWCDRPLKGILTSYWQSS